MAQNIFKNSQLVLPVVAMIREAKGVIGPWWIQAGGTFIPQFDKNMGGVDANPFEHRLTEKPGPLTITSHFFIQTGSAT